MANWRDIDEVAVGWAGKPELGYLRCEVLDRYQDDPLALRETHPVKLVRWAHGKPARVTWCHSEDRYVFCPIHPTCTFVYRGVGGRKYD